MHGRIFVIADENSLKKGDRFCPFEESDMVDWILGCDYVVKESEKDFRESVNWLAKRFNLEISIETKDSDGEKVPVGVLDQKGVKSLIQALEKDRKNRLKAVRDELEKEDPDMWRIAQLSYNDSAFYFVFDNSFFNEMDFLYQKEKEYSIFITESYDYHC